MPKIGWQSDLLDKMNLNICYQVYDVSSTVHVPSSWYKRTWSLSLSMLKVANMFTVRVPFQVTVGVMFIDSRKVPSMVTEKVIGNTTAKVLLERGKMIKVTVQCPNIHNFMLARTFLVYLELSDHCSLRPV